jgi:hypothetical protein
LVPWCLDRVLANPDVRDCLRDAELDEIADDLRTGSSVLTSNEFKARRAKHIRRRQVNLDEDPEEDRGVTPASCGSWFSAEPRCSRMTR